MQYAILGLLVVTFIGFCVVVWKAAKDWRWYNIVAVVVTMLLAMIFLYPTAGVLKSRAAWHKIKEELEVQAAQVKAEYQTIKYGDPSNPEAGEGVVVLDQRLSKLGIEAGRRWRNLQLRNVANNNITLGQDQTATAPPPDIPVTPPAEGEEAAAAPEPAAPQPLIPDGLVVYGFAETPLPNTNPPVLVPTFYLGEFKVSGPTPTQVTLTPTGQLEQNQLAAIGNQQARSWSLYELLPLDGHDPFVALGSEPDDDNALGRVDSDAVRQLLGNRVKPETLNDYLRDGGRLTADDPPLSRWTKIEFIKTHRIQVDSPEQRGALDGGFFDENGRAVDGRLQRGEDGNVTFKKEDQALVKEEAANQLIDEGAARLVDRYYLRPLNDYRFLMRRIRLRLNDLAERKKELEFEKAVLEKAIEKTQAMIVTGQVVKDKLEQDLAQFRVEKTAIQEYKDDKQKSLDAMRAEMNRLYRQNIEYERQLEEKHLEIERRLDGFTMAR